jgi:hypothetical protein
MLHGAYGAVERRSKKNENFVFTTIISENAGKEIKTLDMNVFNVNNRRAAAISLEIGKLSAV